MSPPGLSALTARTLGIVALFFRCETRAPEALSLMHLSLPIGSIGRWFRDWYGYFRTGIAVEGRAWLCDYDHASWYIDGQPSRPELQHIDVDLRFWNRRSGRVTVLDIAEARVPLLRLELTDAAAQPFKPVTLEQGDKQEESYFILLPKHAPESRVEATTGALLELEFRPSRGSERWGRPTISLPLELRRPDDRLG